MKRILLTFLMCLGCAGAAPKPPPGGPPPPPKQELRDFVEARTFLARARALAATLQAGEVFARDTPSGPRLAVALIASGKRVASAFVTRAGHLVPRGEERFEQGAESAALDPGARAALAGEVAQLSLSNFARVAGPQVHFFLLSDSRVVAELRFDRRRGTVLEDLPLADPAPPKLPKLKKP